MLGIGETIDNRTICDLFGVANTGGIRVNRERNLIVLVSNRTGGVYSNEWKGDVLHFVGRGDTGPQKLDRQNATLSRANSSNAALHLFEVFEKGKYVYSGLVELAGTPYMSEQKDSSGNVRMVWLFPLMKQLKPSQVIQKTESRHLPHGAYAVIAEPLTDAQKELVHRKLDELAVAGVSILDKRDIAADRYGSLLTRWHHDVMERSRVLARQRIARLKLDFKRADRDFSYAPDEIEINAQADEATIRSAFEFVGLEDEVEAIFEQARSDVEMPNAPSEMSTTDDVESEEPELLSQRKSSLGRFEEFT